MRFDSPLKYGVLLRRYKRFLADIRLQDGSIITAHCPNPGSMMGLAEPGSGVWVSLSDNPKRKLAYSLELIEDHRGSLVGVHTGRANALVEEALNLERITELAHYHDCCSEVAVEGRSRLDFRLRDPAGRCCFLEVKSVTLRRDDGSDGLAEFPDAVTQRGARHLRALAGLIGHGHQAAILYLVQRSDCSRFRIAGDIDPQYARASADAHGQGVQILCYACHVTPTGVTLDRPIPVEEYVSVV